MLAVVVVVLPCDHDLLLLVYLVLCASFGYLLHTFRGV